MILVKEAGCVKVQLVPFDHLDGVAGEMDSFRGA